MSLSESFSRLVDGYKWQNEEQQISHKFSPNISQNILRKTKKSQKPSTPLSLREKYTIIVVVVTPPPHQVNVVIPSNVFNANVMKLHKNQHWLRGRDAVSQYFEGLERKIKFLGVPLVHLQVSHQSRRRIHPKLGGGGGYWAGHF